MNRSEALLTLSLVVEPGDPRLVSALRDHSPSELVARFRRGGGVWPEVWVTRCREVESRLAGLEQRAERRGLRWLARGRPGWPPALDDLDEVEPWHGSTGAPLGLWLRGTGRPGLLATDSVAVVGARHCTSYGATTAAEIAADLADAGVTVVSGAAFGIDAAAHRGALSLERPGVAVLACGADIDYPRAHAALLHRVAEEGLVVSEQPPGEPPHRSRFLSRNRIIAALTRGTVVVEARVRSGSLNTLHWADRLSRATMAVPGPVTSQQSGGAHRAIRDGEAVLVTDGADVLTELGGPGSEEAGRSGPETEYDRLGAGERAVLDAVSWTEAMSSAALAEAAGLTLSGTRPALDSLEHRGLLARTSDGWLLARRPDRR